MSESPILFWFRNNLRLKDNPALAAAARSGAPVIPFYILASGKDVEWELGGASRWWLGRSLDALETSLRKRGSRLILRRGDPEKEILKLARETGAGALYFTRGYEPFFTALEKDLKTALNDEGVECRRYGGNLLIEPEEIKNKSGDPFKVFTPFYKAALQHEPIAKAVSAPSELETPDDWPESDKLEDWALEPEKPDWAKEMRRFWTLGEDGARERLSAFIDDGLAGYAEDRNRPDMDGSSRLSPYLTSGEISPRQIWHAVKAAADRKSKQDKGAEAFIRELYWREFSSHLLFHWPDLPDKPFKPEFKHIPWKKSRKPLRAWQKGLTGYPIVDAGMRQLWAIGWMHNRVRMITASLLTKHLLIRWQDGEAWFWDTLVDADLANNSAGWQWVAGSGADASPYFRVFNPILQGKKFDPDGNYVRRWVPELAELPAGHIHEPWEVPEHVLREAGVTLGVNYPLPIITHEDGRKQALDAYDKVKAAANKD